MAMQLYRNRLKNVSKLRTLYKFVVNCQCLPNVMSKGGAIMRLLHQTQKEIPLKYHTSRNGKQEGSAAKKINDKNLPFSLVLMGPKT